MKTVLALGCLLSAQVAFALPDAGSDALNEGFDRPAAQRLAQSALAKIKEGAWGEAADRLRQARDKDPKNPAIITDLGFALAHLGARAEAERLYLLAIDLDPRRFYAYVNLAELWTTDPMRWQRRDEMIGLLERALDTLATDGRARAHVELWLAELQRSLGRGAEARARVQHLTGTDVPAPVRRRASRMLEELEAESHQRILRDWPEPVVPPEDSDRLKKLATTTEDKALPVLDDLLGRWPEWCEARWQRARILERLGREDEAVADLSVVVQLAPSRALAWRHLGILLAKHSGRAEAERADQALRQALALEPSWADLREWRAQVAAKRNRGNKPKGAPAPEPSPKARQLFRDAQSWINQEAPEMATPGLRQALADSPGFVDAAVVLYGLEHRMPEATIKALWNDGASLWRLAVQVGALHDREAAELARPWIDRAVELDEQEARFARASMRAAAGDRPGALEDLRAYVAAEPQPARLDEAQALRAGLQSGDVHESPEQVATLHLIADNPAEAKAVLGGSCRPGLPLANLLALGRVYEFTAEPKLALVCYQQALQGADLSSLPKINERIGAVAVALPLASLHDLRPTLETASLAGGALPCLALARLAEEASQWEQAQAQLQLFFARAASDEPRLDEARALQARVSKALEGERRQSHERTRLLVALLGVSLLLTAVLALWRWSRTRSVASALRTQPLLFPALSHAISQIRHDVLKHRASSLELLADPSTNQEDVARALLEPTPVSRQVADIYEHLAKESQGLGLRLRPMAREPVFGPLLGDLLAVEDLLRRPDPSRIPKIRALDQRLRGRHADRLQDLLRSGPRTLVDANLITHWIDGVTGTASPPGLYLQEAQIAFPLPANTLASLFSNLLRNAVQVSPADALLEIRVENNRDPLGRRQVSLAVRDASPLPLSEADVEQRPSDRGLGIVRETVRRWGGQVFVRSEASPFVKAVGVRFPAPPEVKS